MSSLVAKDQAIEKLPRKDLSQLTGWLSTYFSTACDRKIEEDIATGRFDDLAAEAIAEYRALQSFPLPVDEE